MAIWKTKQIQESIRRIAVMPDGSPEALIIESKKPNIFPLTSMTPLVPLIRLVSGVQL